MRITKQYKVGRGVAFYDVLQDNGSLMAKTSKDNVVQLVENGNISNAKIQWWQGKPIVRLQDKDIPLVKLSDDGAETELQAVTRSRGNNGHSSSRSSSDVIMSVADKSRVAGKISNKKKARNVSLAGYDVSNISDKVKMAESLNKDITGTVGDVIDDMIDDFGLKEKNTYKNELAKKLNMSREISTMNNASLHTLRQSVAIYLMNMSYDEIQNTYLKYS